MSFWADKDVVVTGGGGFLGSHVVERLVERGPKSVFVVRSRDYDLTKKHEAERLFKDQPCHILMHFAGLVGGIGANKEFPADFFYRNIMMNTQTLHQAWEAGVQKVVAAGAGCGYPEHAPLPLKEIDFWNGYPQEESAPYSLAKRMLMVQANAYWRQHQFPIIVGIPGNAYGPYDNFDLAAAHVVPALVRKFIEAADEGKNEVVVWGSGKPTRDFVYAGDVAEGLLVAAEKYEEPSVFNLSTGKEFSIRELVNAIVENTGVTTEIVWDESQPDGQARRVMDVSKAKAELGFEARTGLEEGLRHTIEWYRANRSDARNKASA